MLHGPHLAPFCPHADLSRLGVGIELQVHPLVVQGQRAAPDDVRRAPIRAPLGVDPHRRRIVARPERVIGDVFLAGPGPHPDGKAHPGASRYAHLLIEPCGVRAKGGEELLRSLPAVNPPARRLGLVLGAAVVGSRVGTSRSIRRTSLLIVVPELPAIGYRQWAL